MEYIPLIFIPLTILFVLLNQSSQRTTKRALANTQEAIEVAKQWEGVANKWEVVAKEFQRSAKAFESIAEQNANTRDEAMRMLQRTNKASSVPSGNENQLVPLIP